MDYDEDEDALASKSLTDNMEAEAHANIILATDLDQPIHADDIALTNARRSMALSDHTGAESWDNEQRYTDASGETNTQWAVLTPEEGARLVLGPVPEGPGASAPATLSVTLTPTPCTRSTPAAAQPGRKDRTTRGASPPHFQLASTPTTALAALKIMQGAGLPDSFPALDENAKKLAKQPDGKGVRDALPPLQPIAGHHSFNPSLDTIVVRRTLDAYKVQKSKENPQQLAQAAPSENGGQGRHWRKQTGYAETADFPGKKQEVWTCQSKTSSQ